MGQRLCYWDMRIGEGEKGQGRDKKEQRSGTETKLLDMRFNGDETAEEWYGAKAYREYEAWQGRNGIETG